MLPTVNYPHHLQHVSFVQEPWLFEANMHHFISDIMTNLAIHDMNEIQQSLQRAFVVCGTLQLPISRNFKKVYRWDGESMVIDWKISPLACYLIVINSNPSHHRVAIAQLYYAVNRAAKG